MLNARRRYIEPSAELLYEDYFKRRYQQEHSEVMDTNLKHMLAISGISEENGPWGDVYQQISEAESPMMALYCLCVVMGYTEVLAYSTVIGTPRKEVPADFKERAQPYLATLLLRFMPSRTRLLMHMEDIMGDKRVDAQVRSNMMQFMAKYMLTDPSPTSGLGISGDSGVTDDINKMIMARGGVLFIPAEGQKAPTPQVVEGQHLIDQVLMGDGDGSSTT